MSNNQRTYRADIDGLRAVSILLVVGFHAGLSAVGGGFVGVDVFFVLSGYLITSLLIGEQQRTGRISLKDFYARRARRLLPLAFVVIAVTVAAGFFLIVPLRRADLVGDARAASLYLANWRFAGQSVAYSDIEVSESLFVHYWSLSIEEQFYVFWPIAIVGVAAWCRRRSSLRFTAALFAVTTAIVCLSFALSLIATRRGPDAYYFTHARVWELGVGAALAVVAPRLPRLPRGLAELLSIAGLLMIVAAAVTYDVTTAFPGYAALLPVLGCAVLIAVGASQSTTVSLLLSQPPMTYLGRVSYAWYLWHWPVIGLAVLWNERSGGSWTVGEVTAVAVVASFGLATMSHALIEQPTRHARLLTSRPAYSLGLGAALTIAPVLLGIALLSADSASRTVVTVSGAHEDTEDRPPGSNLHTSIPGPNLQVAPVDAEGLPFVPRSSNSTPPPEHVAPPVEPMTPEQAAADTPAVAPDGCHSGPREVSARQDCEFGSPDSSRTVALLGDSHAHQWLPALDQAGHDNDWAILSWSKSACTFIHAPIWNTPFDRYYEQCDDWRGEVLDELRRRGGVEVLVLADSYGYAGLVLDDEGDRVDNQSEVLAIWRAAAERTYAELADVTDQVVLLRDTPWLDEAAPECLSWDPAKPERCEFPLNGHAWLDEKFVIEELAASGDGPAVAVVDMTEWVCETDPCSTVTSSGVIKYRDRHHLTHTFAHSLAEPLADSLRPFVDGEDTR